MNTIVNLPYEIYDIILGNDCLDVEDLISFRNTCRHLHYVCSTYVRNRVWRKHFFKRWPRLKSIYENLGLEQNTKFLDHSILRVKFRKELNDFMALWIQSDYSDPSSTSDLVDCFTATGARRGQADPMTFYFTLDEFVMMFRKQHLDAYGKNNCCDWCLMWENHKVCSQFEKLSRHNTFEKWDGVNWNWVDSIFLQAALLQVLPYIRKKCLKSEWKMQRLRSIDR